ncbi:MAG: thiamine-phosphate kinase [Alphaproteobacteria bacterium]|nr:thiamine-phosphate kinase [Alphaproteobacteria bacterium]MCB9692559.1 thiamine-phosphate kinase [Alphaproteobacteria bacterium]
MEPPSPDAPRPSEGAEANIIDRLERSTRGSARAEPPEIGIGDDATVLPDGTVWSMDVLVEGVHFDARLAPEDVGYKAVAVSVSDVAAMGALPCWVLLGVSVPADDAFVEGLTAGVAEACRHFGVALAGGDTTRSPGARVITGVVGGRCAARPLLRSGGRPGDDVWVSGALGAAGAGWSRSTPPDWALAALRRPEPPVELAVTLAREGLATAAMDLSDGLATDLARLCRASGCGAEIDSAALPRPHDVSVREATRGGEDYQLLFTASPAHRTRIAALGDVTRIGQLTAGPAVWLDGGDWPTVLFAHFGGAR